MRRLLVLLAVLLCVTILAGCSSLNVDLLELRKSIAMKAIYPNDQQTDVTITYTVQPPPQGKVYVLWILNPTLHQSVNAGEVPSGFNQVAHATVDFPATGAIVAIEDSPNAQKMSNTWALDVGQIR